MESAGGVGVIVEALNNWHSVRAGIRWNKYKTGGAG